MSQSNVDNGVKSVTGDILAEVAETLKNSNDVVRGRLTAMLVERKLASRVDVLDKALSKLNDCRNELRKMKPDQVSFVNGEKQEAFSKDSWEKKSKAEEAMSKLEKALESALSGENFDKLQELVK